VGKERGDIYIQDIRRGDYRERKDNMLCYLLQTGKKTPVEKENNFLGFFYISLNCSLSYKSTHRKK